MKRNVNTYSSKKLQFVKEGYLYLPNFFPEDLIDGAMAETSRHFIDQGLGRYPKDLDITKCEVKAWQPVEAENQVFIRIKESPTLNEVCTDVFGEDYLFLYSILLFSPTNSLGQAWHQDCLENGESIFSANCLIYLDDISEETGGALGLVPGTHKMADIPPGEAQENLPGEVLLYPKKGDLILVHGRTYHRVTPVLGSRPRISLNFRVAPKDTPRSITDVGLYRNVVYDFSKGTVIEHRI